MKKTIVKVLALALVAVMMCAVLVSCSAPNADPSKANDALKDAGYSVIYNDGSVGIGGISISTLPEGVEASIIATKGDDNYIVITYYKEASDANDAWEEAEKEAEELKEKYEDIVCKKSGKMIYLGTKEAVKAAQ